MARLWKGGRLACAGLSMPGNSCSRKGVARLMLIIDRFEGKFAVCEEEEGTFREISRDQLPPESKEGDCLDYQDGTYQINREETQRRREEILRLQNSLWDS